MKKRYLLYAAYLIICLFPLLVVLCSHGLVGVDDVLGTLPLFPPFSSLFSYFGITNVWLTYILKYMSYLLFVAFAKTAYYAVTFVLDCADKFLRRDL